MSDRDETPRRDALFNSIQHELGSTGKIANKAKALADYDELAKNLECQNTALAAKLAEAEQRAERLRRALGMMVNLHRGKLLCASDETDRQCLNRVTAETLSAADAALKG